MRGDRIAPNLGGNEARPQLAICIYHSKTDMFEIPLHLNRSLSGYVFRLGHYSPSLYSTVLYAIPREVARESVGG